MVRHYWKHFATAIAALSASATLLTALFNFDFVKDRWYYGAIGAAIVLAGSLRYACWQIKSKKKISAILSSELNLSISEGDLFEKKGIICIPFNEFFDTHVGDGVVGEHTLHGLFIERFYKDRLEELKNKIQDGLDGVKYVDCKRRKDFCPTKKYPLGTCVDIRDGENLYVLFALTHFDNADNANISRVEYAQVVNNLLSHLTEVAHEKPVFMPLIGTGMSRMRRTSHRILLHLVDTLDFNDACSIPGGIHIVIKSLEDTSVNLTMLEHIIKEGITETE